MVYETKYHLVWTPKYRQGVLPGELRKRGEELCREIAQDCGFASDTREGAAEHGHLLLDFPPRYAMAKVVGILRSIAASQVFVECPAIKKPLWAGELWADGYFARTVGDKVTAAVIRRYILGIISKPRGNS